MHINDDGFDLFDLSITREPFFDLTKGLSLIPFHLREVRALERGRRHVLKDGRWRWVREERS